jgi:hypothetical protein
MAAISRNITSLFINSTGINDRYDISKDCYVNNLTTGSPGADFVKRLAPVPVSAAILSII